MLRKAEEERLGTPALLRSPQLLCFPPLIEFFSCEGYWITPSSRPTFVKAAMA